MPDSNSGNNNVQQFGSVLNPFSSINSPPPRPSGPKPSHLQSNANNGNINPKRPAPPPPPRANLNPAVDPNNPPKEAPPERPSQQRSGIDPNKPPTDAPPQRPQNRPTQPKSDEVTVNGDNPIYADLNFAAMNTGNQVEESFVPIAREGEEVGVQYTQLDFGDMDRRQAVNKSGINPNDPPTEAPPQRPSQQRSGIDPNKPPTVAPPPRPLKKSTQSTSKQSTYVTADAVNINRQGQEGFNSRFSPEEVAKLVEAVNRKVEEGAIRRQGLSSGYVTFPQEQGPTRVTGDVREWVVGQSQASNDPNGRLNLGNRGFNLGDDLTTSSSTEDQNPYAGLDGTEVKYVQTEGQKLQSTYVEPVGRVDKQNNDQRYYEQPVPQNPQNQPGRNESDTDYAVTNRQLSTEARDRSNTTKQHVGAPQVPPRQVESPLNRDSSKIFSDIVRRVPSPENQIISNENLQAIFSDLKQHSELESKNPLLSEFANSIAILSNKEDISQVEPQDIEALDRGELKVLFDSFNKAREKKSELESSISDKSESSKDLEAIFGSVDKIIDKEASLNFLEEAEKGMKNFEKNKGEINGKAVKFEKRSKKVEEESKNFVQQKFKEYDSKQQNQSQTQNQTAQNNQSPEDWTQNITRSGVKKAAAVVGTAALFATGFGVLALIAGAILYGVMKSKDKGANVDDAMSKVLPKGAMDILQKSRDMVLGRSGGAQISSGFGEENVVARRNSEYTRENLSGANDALSELKQMTESDQKQSLLKNSGLDQIANLLEGAKKGLQKANSVSQSTPEKVQQTQGQVTFDGQGKPVMNVDGLQGSSEGVSTDSVNISSNNQQQPAQEVQQTQQNQDLAQNNQAPESTQQNQAESAQQNQEQGSRQETSQQTQAEALSPQERNQSSAQKVEPQASQQSEQTASQNNNSSKQESFVARVGTKRERTPQEIAQEGSRSKRPEVAPKPRNSSFTERAEQQGQQSSGQGVSVV